MTPFLLVLIPLIGPDFAQVDSTPSVDDTEQKPYICEYTRIGGGHVGVVLSWFSLVGRYVELAFGQDRYPMPL